MASFPGIRRPAARSELGTAPTGARLGDFQGKKDILARLIGMLIYRNASEVRIQTVRAEPFGGAQDRPFGGAQGERNAKFLAKFLLTSGNEF